MLRQAPNSEGDEESEHAAEDTRIAESHALAVNSGALVAAFQDPPLVKGVRVSGWERYGGKDLAVTGLVLGSDRMKDGTHFIVLRPTVPCLLSKTEPATLERSTIATVVGHCEGAVRDDPEATQPTVVLKPCRVQKTEAVSTFLHKDLDKLDRGRNGDLYGSSWRVFRSCTEGHERDERPEEREAYCRGLIQVDPDVFSRCYERCTDEEPIWTCVDGCQHHADGRRTP